MNSDCVFCKIIAGQIPCYRLYEDEHILSFLDVGPVANGHCLVIPKKHIARLDDAQEQDAIALAAIMTLVPKLGGAVVKHTGAAGWNLLQNNGAAAGQVVEHVHFHIIPRHEGDGLGYRWPAGSLDAAGADDLATSITSHLAN